MTPKAIERMVKSGALDDAEWTIEILEGFEDKARRALATATLPAHTRDEVVADWADSVAWILANDKRSDVLDVAQAMSERME